MKTLPVGAVRECVHDLVDSVQVMRNAFTAIQLTTDAHPPEAVQALAIVDRQLAILTQLAARMLEEAGESELKCVTVAAG